MGAELSCGCVPNNRVFSDVTWKLALDPVKTKRKYVDDETLTPSCSLAELELRALLDSPIAVRYLSTNSREENNQRLLGLWFDCREWSKLNCFRHTRLVEIFDNYKDLLFLMPDKDLGLVAIPYLRELQMEFSQGFVDGMTGQDRDLHVTTFFLKVQAACFEQLFLLVYSPFTCTAAYDKLFRLICDPDSWVTPGSFEYGRVIAQGAFGVVVTCVKKSTGIVYAMKIQPKATLLKLYRSDKRRVMTEMQAYAVCDHPYVAKLCYAMQSESLAMLVMPIAECGDLGRSLLFTECGYFSHQRVQFYTAEIVSALLYLHNFGLIYRDLKLGNVLLHANGHISLADFGSLADMNGILNAQFHENAPNMSNNCHDLAQLDVRRLDPEHSCHSVFSPGKAPVSLQEKSTFEDPESVNGAAASTGHLDGNSTSKPAMRTKSLVGTMEYMAPEIICMFGKRRRHEDGYTAAVDWWGLGVLIYHMSTGKVPFKRVSYRQLETQMPSLLASTQDAFETVFLTIFGEPDYSHSNLVDESVDLIKRLLEFNPEERLGSGLLHELVPAEMCPVRMHNFFAGINWTAIEVKGVAPPYIPVLEVAGGTNFGASARGEFPQLSGLLEQMNKIEWIDDSMDYAYAPPAPAAFTHMIGALTASVVHSIRSRVNTLTGNTLTNGDADSSLRKRAGVSSGNNSVNSRRNSNNSTAISPAKFLAARRLIEVDAKDQGHFFGWNYVSPDLVETSNLTSTRGERIDGSQTPLFLNEDICNDDLSN